ncbi:MAG: RNA polymerase sigma factor [Pirellulales bacterium]|nr:RNA polymerase sigma factor [Pirellulales bacterium]
MKADVMETADDDVRLAMTGDEQAIQRLIQCWYRRVYAHCQAKLISTADAEDATQETFLRCCARIEQLRSPEAIGGWLRGIAHHVCVDFIRRNQVRQSVSENVEELSQSGAHGSPANRVEQLDQQHHLIGLIHQLPEPLREAILLHYFEDMTYDQMAKWLGVARSTVNDRLSKARNLLRRELLPERRCCDELS